MNLRRLHLGEVIAAASAIALLAVMFVRWYRGPNGEDINAWQAFTVVDVLLAIAIALALALAVLTVTQRSPALPISAAVWTTLFALVATVAIIVRIIDKPGGAVTLCVGAWLGLAAAVGILAGGWQTMRDEHT